MAGPIKPRRSGAITGIRGPVLLRGPQPAFVDGRKQRTSIVRNPTRANRNLLEIRRGTPTEVRRPPNEFPATQKRLITTQGTPITETGEPIRYKGRKILTRNPPSPFDRLAIKQGLVEQRKLTLDRLGRAIQKAARRKASGK